jgi:hypothetical protein
MSVSDSASNTVSKVKITQITGSLAPQTIANPDSARKFFRVNNRTNQIAYLSLTEISGASTEVAALAITSGEWQLPFSWQGITAVKWLTVPTSGKLIVSEFYE